MPWCSLNSLGNSFEHPWPWRKQSTLPSAASVLPRSANPSSHTQRFKHGSQDARRRDSHYLFCFRLILAGTGNCRPRRGSRRPSGRRSGRCSWCSPAAAALSSGNGREAAAGHLREFTRYIPREQFLLLDHAKQQNRGGSASVRFQQASPALGSPHISSTPFASRRTPHAIMGREIIAHCPICFDTGCFLGFSTKSFPSALCEQSLHTQRLPMDGVTSWETKSV